MQNEFEKQVQQKMEDLKLVPSEPVWQKVELQIRGRREKRRFIFFLLPVGLLLAGAIAYWMWDSSDNNTIAKKQESFPSPIVNQSKQNFKKENTNEKTNNVTVQNKTSNQTKNNSKPVIHQSSVSASPIATDLKSLPERKTKTQARIINQKISFGKVDKEKIPLIDKSNSSIAENKKTETSSEQIQKESLVLKDTATSYVGENNTTSQQVQTEQPKNMVVDSADKKEKNSIISPVDSQQIISKKKIVSSPKWKKTITIQLGTSRFREGLFAGIFDGGQKSMDYASSPQGNVNGGQTIFYPSAVTKGFSFVAGGGVERSLGKRLQFNASIQYHYYSTHTQVGTSRRQDTSFRYASSMVTASSFYNNTTATIKKDYTNKFGIVEIPVSIGYQLFRRLPLQFSIGASYGRLLKSNLLTFDHTSNLYYYNKDNNVKNFMSVFSSLQYRITNKNKMKITAGPVWQFNPTEIQKENRYTIPHLFFWGLKTDISF